MLRSIDKRNEGEEEKAIHDLNRLDVKQTPTELRCTALNQFLGLAQYVRMKALMHDTLTFETLNVPAHES